MEKVILTIGPSGTLMLEGSIEVGTDDWRPVIIDMSELDLSEEGKEFARQLDIALKRNMKMKLMASVSKTLGLKEHK
jgi:hypothetical protein